MTDERAHIVEVESPCTFTELQQAVHDARLQHHQDLRLLAGTVVTDIPFGGTKSDLYVMDRTLRPGDYLLGIVAV